MLVIITSSQTVSTVVDSSSNTYASRASAGLATATLGAYVYFYLANLTSVPARGSTLTITVTFSSSAFAGIECLDIAGIGVHPVHTASSTYTLNSVTSQILCDAPPFQAYCVKTPNLNVTSWTPSVGNFVISAVAAYSCSSNSFYVYGTGTSNGALFNWPPIPTDNDAGPYPQPSGLFTTMNQALGQAMILSATSCATSMTFGFWGFYSYKKAWVSGSTIQNYTDIQEYTPVTTGNSANYVELAAEFPATTTVVQSVSETVGLSVSNALRNPFNTETIGLTPITQIAQKVNSEVEGLFIHTALGTQINSEAFCLGVKANLTDGVYIVNTGPVCGAPVVVGTLFIAPCTFFQLQCWAIPLMFLGMIDGFFMGVAGAFRVSEKSFVYLTFAGLTWGSLVEISLGIMTPALPVLLLAMNIAYSFRLDKVIVSTVGAARR